MRLESMKKIVSLKNILLTAVSLAMCGALSGCITSEKPLSPPGFKDDALLGSWTKIEPGAEPADLIIRADKDKEGFYAMEEREYRQNQEPHVEHYRGFPTQGKKSNYGNLEYAEAKKKENPKFPTDYETHYVVLRYKIDGDKLTVNAVKYETLKKAVESKLIKGSAWETTWGVNARINDDPAKLLALFEGEKGDEYFGESLVYQRKDPNK